MKVKDLIKLLNSHDKEMDVVIWNDEFGSSIDINLSTSFSYIDDFGYLKILPSYLEIKSKDDFAEYVEIDIEKIGEVLVLNS